MLGGPSLVVTGLLLAGHGHGDSRNVIPAFARRYRVGCSHCHVAAPKLNAVGEAFRLNGYRFPESLGNPRGEPDIPLGEEPWKDLWPKAIWPGALPGSVPLSLRMKFDLEVARNPTGETGMTFRFPQNVDLVAGASLGEHIGVFFEGEWSRDEGPELEQAKVVFQGLIPSLGDRRLNLWLGLQNLFLLTFADRGIDRAARQTFLWQRFRPAEVTLPGGSGELVPRSEFRLDRSGAAVELNGLLTPRFYYGVGLAQGAGEATADNNRHKDAYYKLRYKAAGMALDGSFPARPGSVSAGYGQLRDRAFIVETFGYFGSEPTVSDEESRHRALGVSLRLVGGPADIGAGYVWGRDDRPWGAGLGALERSSVFARGEYLVYPWLMASLKGEWFTIRTPTPGAPPGRVRFAQTHLMPGFVALIRQNVHLIAEADFFLKYQSPAGAAAPRGLWLRLDLAF